MASVLNTPCVCHGNALLDTKGGDIQPFKLGQPPILRLDVAWGINCTPMGSSLHTSYTYPTHTLTLTLIRIQFVRRATPQYYPHGSLFDLLKRGRRGERRALHELTWSKRYGAPHSS